MLIDFMPGHTSQSRIMPNGDTVIIIFDIILYIDLLWDLFGLFSNFLFLFVVIFLVTTN